MSVNITFDGQPYIIAETGEVGWGGNTTSYLVAIAAGCLQKTGGSFILSAETDFGASFGLKSLSYKSRTVDIANAGILRLANNSDSVSWRNAANSADLALAVNASDQITFNGIPLGGSGSGTVNFGLTSFVAYYPADGTTVDDQTLLALTNIASANPRVEFRGVELQAQGRGPILDFYAVTTDPSTQTIVAQVIGCKSSSADGNTEGQYKISVDNGSGLVPRLLINSSGLTTLTDLSADSLTAVDITNQIILGVTDTITLTAPTPAASRIYTIPDAGADANFILSESVQTINGAKTFSDLRGTLGANLDADSNKIINLASGTVASDAVRFDQLKVLQIVTGSSTTEFTTTSVSMVSTNLSATITPTSASSRILIIASSALKSDDAAASEALAGLSRGTTDLLTAIGQAQVGVVGASDLAAPCTLTFIDSPATTSATTYRVRIRNTDGTTIVRFGRGGGGNQHMILMEVV